MDSYYPRSPYNITAEQQYPTPYATSFLLPFLLMSLSQQKHTPRTARHIRYNYDYIIVGAGSAGSTLAGRLSEKQCVSVLVLEAGKSPSLLSDIPGIARSFFQTDIDWNLLTEPQEHTAMGLKDRKVAWPSGKALGGSSVINAMLHVRGNRKNYDDWASLGAEGWSYNDVLPYFKKLEDNKNYGDTEYHATGGPITTEKPRYDSQLKIAVQEAARALGYSVIDSNGQNQNGFFDIQANLRNAQRCSTAKAYLVPAEGRPNIDIVPEAFVKKVIIRDGRATGVQFDKGGRQYEIMARKEVILSAGTVNSAQLLMLSGIGPRDHLEAMDIPVVSDLPVGKNFQDHVASIMGFEVSSNIMPFADRLADSDYVRQYIQQRRGPLASVQGVSGIAFLPNDGSQDPSVKPDHEVYFMEGANDVARTQMNIKPEVFKQVFGPYDNKTTFWCISQVTHPRSRGVVKLRSKDPHTPAFIDPRYFENPRDLQDVVEGMKLCKSVGASEALKKIGTKRFTTTHPGCEEYADDEEESLKCQAKSVVITLSHPTGTARMGRTNDPAAVVDPQLRVKGVKGLRVVDASVMPLVTSGNTNVPTIMIAEKAADIIKKEIQCW